MIAAIVELFFSAITATPAIVAIIWKPGLSYASLINKIRSITIILSKQQRCIMLFTYSCLNCRNEEGLLNFVTERIKLVYCYCFIGRALKYIIFYTLPALEAGETQLINTCVVPFAIAESVTNVLKQHPH